MNRSDADIDPLGLSKSEWGRRVVSLALGEVPDITSGPILYVRIGKGLYIKLDPFTQVRVLTEPPPIPTQLKVEHVDPEESVWMVNPDWITYDR